MDQRGLVERARGGDHDAFTALVDLTIARLDTAAHLIVRDRELARGAVQTPPSAPGATCRAFATPIVLTRGFTA